MLERGRDRARAADEETKVRAAGMDAFLPKPVRMSALGALLAKWTALG
jgi:CheY-like chemotaxis protein